MLVPPSKPAPQKCQQLMGRCLWHRDPNHNSALFHLATEIGELLPTNDADVIVRDFDGQAGTENTGDNYGLSQSCVALAHEVVLP